MTEIHEPMLPEPFLSLARDKLDAMIPAHVAKLFPSGCDIKVFVGFSFKGREQRFEVGFWHERSMQWGISAGRKWPGNTITLTPIELL